MNYVLFSVYFLIRLLVLIATTIVFGFVFWKEDWVFSQMVIAGVIVILVIEFLFFVRKTERELNVLLEILSYDDYSRTLYQGKKSSELINVMEKIKNRQEEKFNTLQHKELLIHETVEASGVGMCIIENDKDVLLLNQDFQELLNLSNVATATQLFSQYPGLENDLKSIREQGRLVLNPEEYEYAFNHKLNLQIYHKKIDQKSYMILLLTKTVAGSEGLDFDAWINFGKVISHEINNGITPVMSLSESVVHLLENESTEESKEKIIEACTIIAEQCKTLLNFNEKYRQLVKIPPLNMEVIGLQQTIESVFEIYRNEISDITVEFEFPETSPIIEGDVKQLQQVFSNLLLNSIEALRTITEKRITLTVFERKENYIVEFHDTGIGIPEALRSSVFIPYFSTRENGSGIGLSLTRQILWKHGGQIHLKTGTSGCTFVLIFPKRSLLD